MASATFGAVANSEHVYDIPGEEELAQLVGAATPHFALQARDRIAGALARLPTDHPRRPEITAHLRRLEEIAVVGEVGGDPDPDLPPGPSLTLPE